MFNTITERPIDKPVFTQTWNITSRIDDMTRKPLAPPTPSLRPMREPAIAQSTSSKALETNTSCCGLEHVYINDQLAEKLPLVYHHPSIEQDRIELRKLAHYLSQQPVARRGLRPQRRQTSILSPAAADSRRSTDDDNITNRTGIGTPTIITTSTRTILTAVSGGGNGGHTHTLTIRITLTCLSLDLFVSLSDVYRIRWRRGEEGFVEVHRKLLFVLSCPSAIINTVVVIIISGIISACW